MSAQLFDKEKWKNTFVDLIEDLLKKLCPNLDIEHDALIFIEELLIKLMGLVIDKNPNSVQVLENIITQIIPYPINDYAIKKAESVIKECFGSSRLDDNHDSNQNQPQNHLASTNSLVKIVNLVPSLSSLNSNHSTNLNLSNCTLVMSPIIKQIQQILKLDQRTSIYLCALLEYIADDILKLVCKYVENIGNELIKLQDVKIALNADKLLMDLFYGKEENINCKEGYSLIFDELSLNEKDDQSPPNYKDIVNELIKEEKYFLRDLNLIIKVFREPFLRLLNTSNSVPNTPTSLISFNSNNDQQFTASTTLSNLNDTFTENDIDLIFGNIIDVYEFSINFLSLIDDTIEMNEKSGIGFCFLELMEGFEFEVFMQFIREIFILNCNNDDEKDNQDVDKQHQPHQHLMNLFENQKVVSCLRSVGQGVLLCIKYVLPKLLNGVVVHCARYLKYIDLLKNSTSDDEERNSLEQSEIALSALKSLLDKVIKGKNFKINESYLKLTKTHGEKQFRNVKKRLEEMNKKIDGFNYTHYSQLCNEFIYEGFLSKARKNDKKSIKNIGENKSERKCYLFDGVLFCCKILNSSNLNNNHHHHEFKEKLKEIYFIRNIEVFESKPNPATDQTDPALTFEIHYNKDHEQKQILIFLAKTKDEKDIWMSNLLLLSQKPILERTLDSILSEEKRRIPLKLPDPDQYRFAEKDSNSNIVFDSSTGKDNIKAATITKLIERLTYHQFADPKFLKTFLTTYRSFCTPENLLDLLIERFKIPFKDDPNEVNNLTREELKRFKKEYLEPIQLRVLNVMKHWVDLHYYDLDDEIRSKLKSFLEQHKEEKQLKKWIESILSRITKKEQSREEIKRKYLCENLPPILNWLELESNEINLLTVHPTEFCRVQLTLYEFDLYCAVNPFELMGAKWTKEDKHIHSPNLIKLIQHNSRLIYWIEKEIVECANMEERLAIINRLVEMLQVLCELNNFNGVFEIISAFERASVWRLETTFNGVNTKNIAIINKMKSYKEDHFKHYINLLHSINPPSVPFFGIYLTQILHLEAGNPDYIDADKKLINFSKRRKIAEITSEIQQYQNQPYCLKVYPELREFIENLDPLEGMTEKEFDDYCYNKSLEIEPRNCKQLPKGERRYKDISLKSPGFKITHTFNSSHATLSSFPSNFHHHQASTSSLISNSNSVQQTSSNPQTPSYNTPSNSTPTSPKLQTVSIQSLHNQHSPPPKSPLVHSNTMFNNVLINHQDHFNDNFLNHSQMNLPNSISMPHHLPSNLNLTNNIIEPPPRIPPRNRASISSIHQRTNSESSTASTTSPNVHSQYNSAFSTPLPTGRHSDVFTFPSLQPNLSSNINMPINVLPLPPKGISNPPALPPKTRKINSQI